MCDDETAIAHEFAIGARFRCLMEARLARLESDASHDEAMIWQLEHGDHIRRQMRLVAVQREEAMRIRRFLEQSGSRAPRSAVAD